MAVLLVLAHAAAGCALYDAFTNSPEGEGNNGNNEAECATGFTVEGREDQCLLECRRSTEFKQVIPPSAVNPCAEGDVCVSLFENRQGSEEIGRLRGVCVTRPEREACGQLSFDDFEDANSTFEPCDEGAAQYRVAARPDGGFVVAGCRRDSSAAGTSEEYGVRVLWLDEYGRLDGRPSDTIGFVPFSKIDEARTEELEPAIQPTVNGLEAIGETSALILIETKDMRADFVSSTVGIVRQGANDLGEAGQARWAGRVDPCAQGIEGGQHVARAGAWFIISSCFDGAGTSTLGFFVGQLDTSADPPRIIDIRNSGLPLTDNIIQDLSVPVDAQDITAGTEVARALVFDPMAERLSSRSLVRDPQGTDPYRLGTAGSRVTENESVTPPKSIGYAPPPRAAQVIDGDGRVTMAGQDSSPSNPRVFSPRTNNEITFSEEGRSENEQTIGLVRAATPFDSVETGPTPDQGNTTFALLTVVGSGPTAFGRLYGIDSELDPVWSVELGRETEFMPQEIASSKDAASGRMAIVGRTSERDIRMFFTDSLGRGFCDLALLDEYHTQPE
jgi:hypothetical protein